MISRLEMKTRAKVAFAEQRVPFVIGYLIILGLSSLAMLPYYLGYFPGYFAWVFEMSATGMITPYEPSLGPMFFGLAISLILMAVVYTVQVAYANMALKALDKQEVQMQDLFSRVQELGRWAGLYVLVSVKTFLWSLLFIVPGIVAMLNYSQAHYLMLEDPNLSPGAAIKESIRLMRGNRVRYFVLGLSFILWNLLVVITFGLAGLFVGPYVEITYAEFYRDLVGPKAGVLPDEEPPPVAAI